MVVLLGSFLLPACGGPTERRWTENVQMDDGAVILVERMVAFREWSSMSGDVYNSVETDASLAFTGELSDLPQWRAPLMALLLYRDPGTRQWVIVATTTSCEVWNTRGEPPTMYWEYRLGPQGWREVPLSASSVGRKANLLYLYQQDIGTRHITVADRIARQSDPKIARQYREILATREHPCTPSVKH